MEKRSLVKCLLVFTFLFVLVGCGDKNNSSKSLTGEEVIETLEYNDYKIRHRYYSATNIYDKKGNCYDFDGNKTDCQREVGIKSEYILIHFDSKNDNSKFIIYIDEDSYSFAYSKYIDEINYSYSIDEGQNNLVGYAYEDGNYCSYVVKGEDEDGNDRCSKTYEEELKELISEMEAELKELELSIDNVFTFGKYYYSEYMESQKADIDYKIENEIITNNEVANYLREGGFTTSIIDDSEYKIVTIKDTLYTFELWVKDNVVTMIYFDSPIYDDTTLCIFPEYNSVTGFSKDLTTCKYDVISDGKVVDQVRSGYTCGSTEIDHIEMLQFSYNWELSDLELKQQEMINYAIAYE